MPTKRRVPKNRNPEITPEAVALFKRGLELQKRGADEIDDDANENTPEQDEYSAIEKRLHWTLLGLIGVAGPLDVYPGMERNPYPELYCASIPHALELRAQLMKAIRR